MSEPDRLRFRLGLVGIVVLALFASLFTRLWYLQMIQRSDSVAAETATYRTLRTEGPRGRILDRTGRVIVDNRTSIVVGIYQPDLARLSADERSSVFSDLANTLATFGISVKVQTIAEAYDDPTYTVYDLRPVASDVDESVELYLSERAARFPGVLVERRSVRFYPYGSAAAHLVGYVGAINEDELAEYGDGRPPDDPPEGEVVEKALESDAFPGKPYQRGSMIGKAGVERAYEYYLRGVPGERVIQVDAAGRYLRAVEDNPAKPGFDVWLNVDLDVQMLAERELAATLESTRGKVTSDGKRAKGEQGSVVLVDPSTGDLVAMASSPTYDPSDFVNGFTAEQFAALTDEDSGRPFNNWAIQGTYAPGSTFKLVTALAGYRSGFLRPGNNSYNDGGVYHVRGCNSSSRGCNPTNANRQPYGWVDVQKAITVSSDVFFYWIGDNLWADRDRYGETAIQDVAVDLGLGSRTGIVLPSESAGRIPTPAWRREVHDANPVAFPDGTWTSGANVNTAVGQGDVLVTPLQLANTYGTFANGGTRWTPQVALRITRPSNLADPPNLEGNYETVVELAAAKAGQYTFDGAQYQTIYRGLVGVTEEPGGTAHSVFASASVAFPVAAKTGTAQVQSGGGGFKADTSVFAGFAPADYGANPARYAFAAILPESGFGGEVAAPLIARILEPISTGGVPAAVPVRGLPPSELRRNQPLESTDQQQSDDEDTTASSGP